MKDPVSRTGQGQGALPEAMMRSHTRDELHELLARAERLLGKEPLQRLIDNHAAAVTRRVAPRHRHRLIEIILRLRAVADFSDSLLLGAAVVNAAELNAALDLYDHWKDSPAWRDFQRALLSPREYLHAVATLSVADQLRVHHPSVELVVATATARTADLMMVVPEESGMAVEVKAPAALWQRERALDIREAVWIVRNRLARAGTGVTGQLAAGRPALLVVAGFLLSEETFEVLMHGADIALRNQQPRRPHLLGIALFNQRARVQMSGGRVEVLLEQQSRIGRMSETDDELRPGQVAIFGVRLPNGKLVEIVSSPTQMPVCRHIYEEGEPVVSTIEIGQPSLGPPRIRVNVCECCLMAPSKPLK